MADDDALTRAEKNDAGGDRGRRGQARAPDRRERRASAAGVAGSRAGPDLFGDAAATKAERKRSLAALFSGRAPARDQTGRFVPKATASFDGGARQPVPEQKHPERAHAELLGEVLRTRAADRGASF